MLLWLSGRPNPRLPRHMWQFLKDQSFVDNLIKKLEDVVWNGLPEDEDPNLAYLKKSDIPANKDPFPVHPHNDPEYITEFWPTVTSIVEKSQRHRHNASCTKYGWVC